MEPVDTLINDNILLLMLSGLAASGEPAALFVDDGGLENVQGIITGITPQATGYQIELNGIRVFGLNQVMAINGTFRTGFSTC